MFIHNSVSQSQFLKVQVTFKKLFHIQFLTNSILQMDTPLYLPFLRESSKIIHRFNPIFFYFFR